ncbi:MAG: hypothetical protein Q9163_005050 [Psora crenata]
MLQSPDFEESFTPETFSLEKFYFTIQFREIYVPKCCILIMAAPQPAMMLPREIVHDSVSLAHKPGAYIHYSLARGPDTDTPPILVVFLNGLMTDKPSWLPVMTGIIRQRRGLSPGFPTMLAYDRYGQGLTTDRDPQDSGKDEGYGHDCADAAVDLHHLISHIATGKALPRLILVANSIGCAIARLYAQEHPVAAVLFLDSIMANSDFDFWPDPDRRHFDIDELPEDVTIEQMREQRAKFVAMFRPDVINNEGLDRRNLFRLLPYSDQPMLGTEGNRPWVTVVGHDFQTFAEESMKTMGTPVSLTMRYSNPIWRQYNRGLAKLTNPKYSKGPFQALNCGHFIQKDDPNLVVDETLDLVDKIRLENSVTW